MKEIVELSKSQITTSIAELQVMEHCLNDLDKTKINKWILLLACF